MADTQKLKDMLDNLINSKPEQAQTVFHAYLQDKLQDKLADVFGTKTDAQPEASGNSEE